MKRVKIYTISDKSPQFIGWQYKSFKDHLKDDYEFIVMNNSSSLDLDEQIQSECLVAGIKCIDVINKDFSHPCFACAAPVQDIIDRFIVNEKECISCIIDSDMFLIKDFSFNEYIEEWNIAGIPQSRNTGRKIIEYIWNGLMIFNNTLPNLSTLDMGCGSIWHAPVDVGGMSYFYLQANPQVKWRKMLSSGIVIDHPEILELIPEYVRSSYQLDMSMEIIEGSFIHYRGGSNWDNRSKEFHEKKQEFIKKLIKI